MINTHVLNLGPGAVRSPADRLNVPDLPGRPDHAFGTALRDCATQRPTAAYRVQASSRPGETSLKSRENREIPPACNLRYLADSTRYTEPPNSRWAAKMLPLNLSGIVMVDQPSASSKSPEGALTSILARLEREKASNLSQTRNRVDFKGGVFRFAWNWNQLVAISHGEIRVERAATGLSIRYEIWFTQLLIVVTVGVAGFFGPPVIAAPNLSTMGKLGVLSAAWLWLTGGNIAITAYRFPRFLRSAVETERNAA
jgi:hypothetical protein